MYEDIESIYPLRHTISYYGADYPIDSLIRKMEDETIRVPRFQRNYVWNPNQASSFIESILLGFPIPTIFLAKDNKNGNLIIIDGQQRLKSLLYFVKGYFSDSKVFRLKNVCAPFNNKTFTELSNEDKYYFMDYTIHSLIIAEPENSNRIYHLFERLNTNGTPLTSQEIRKAIYYGELIELIEELAQDKIWSQFFAQKKERMFDQEMIIRFFAFHYNLDDYNGSLQDFLNHFMYAHRDMEKLSKSELRSLFTNTIHFLYNSLGENAFDYKNRFNVSYYETMVVLTSKYNLMEYNKDIIIHLVERLHQNEEYASLIKSSTTTKRNIFNRYELCFRITEELLNAR